MRQVTDSAQVLCQPLQVHRHDTVITHITLPHVRPTGHPVWWRYPTISQNLTLGHRRMADLLRHFPGRPCAELLCSRRGRDRRGLLLLAVDCCVRLSSFWSLKRRQNSGIAAATYVVHLGVPSPGPSCIPILPASRCDG